MNGIAIFAVIAGAALLGWIFLRLRRQLRRRRLLAEGLPDHLREFLEQEFPRIRALSPELRTRLEGFTRVLMEGKNFEACGGFPKITEEVRCLICAQAALLLLNLPNHRFYPLLKSILVYPGAFQDRGRRRFGLHEEERGTLLGESWDTGSVILSWDSVVAGARNEDDGINVTIHEFAHQLDQANGTDGVPLLHSREAYRRWAEVFETHYDELVEDVEDGDDSLIDPYGATNPAEFFAVASETFFEESVDLREEHPKLYGELRDFYGLDPAEWG